MQLNEIAPYIWNDSKRRNIFIMSIIILCLGGMLLSRLFNAYKPPPPGANRVLICKECGKTDVRRVVDITTEHHKCKKCGGKMLLAWKCGVCKYEYYTIPISTTTEKFKNTMQVFEHVQKSHGCPNCKEMRNVHQMTLKEYEAEK